MTPSAPSSQPAWFWLSMCEPARILRPWRAAEAEHIADAVDLRIEPGFGHALDQPLPRDESSGDNVGRCTPVL